MNNIQIIPPINEIGIYEIKSPSGKKYVGMTSVSFASRWRGHLKDLKRGIHKCQGLQRAYNKYGKDSLIFSILEILPNTSTDFEILKREQFWWDETEKQCKLYNGRPTGTGSVHHTDETKRNISIAITKWHAKSFKPKASVYCLRCNILILKPKVKQKFCSRRCTTIRLTKDEINFIEDLYKDGFSLRQISDKIGFSHITVRNTLIKSGVPLRGNNSFARKII